MANIEKQKVQASIDRLRDKSARIYFFTQDTKGNAKGSIRYIYQMATALKNSGFNPIILHEKNDYTGVASWLGQDYMDNLPHRSIEGQNLEVSPEDFIIVPEIFGYVMDQIKKIPCAKVVLTQSYNYLVETLQPGQSWSQFGFFKCITTSNTQKEYIEKVMRQTSFDVIPPVISSVFQQRELPPMPIVAVHTREQSDTINLIKTFYLRFPQYRWFTFRDMRGLSEKEFSNALKECFLSVWIDEKSGFGTFPLESMACNVPCMGRVPDLKPSWMTSDNGIWLTDVTIITDFIADFIQNWLEDNIRPELYENMKKTVDEFSDINKFNNQVVETFGQYFNTRAEAFEQQISKIED